MVFIFLPREQIQNIEWIFIRPIMSKSLVIYCKYQGFFVLPFQTDLPVSVKIQLKPHFYAHINDQSSISLTPPTTCSQHTYTSEIRYIQRIHCRY